MRPQNLRVEARARVCGMTLVSAMALGADCIDDCDVLRSGAPFTITSAMWSPSDVNSFVGEALAEEPCRGIPCAADSCGSQRGRRRRRAPSARRHANEAVPRRPERAMKIARCHPTRRWLVIRSDRPQPELRVAAADGPSL